MNVRDQKDSILCMALAFHRADMGLIPGTTYAIPEHRVRNERKKGREKERDNV